jgi:hypothetical protein
VLFTDPDDNQTGAGAFTAIYGPAGQGRAFYRSEDLIMHFTPFPFKSGL